MAFVNYAHRGASEYAPENTLSAFYLGIEMGANGIETDIQRTKDGVLVLFHDRSVARVLGREGSICDETYEALLRYDFGAFKQNAKYMGEKLVTLEEFLRFFGDKPLAFALEIKQAGVEREALAMVYRFGVERKVIFTSFDWDSLVAIRAAAPDIALGFLTERITEEVLDLLAAYRVEQVCPCVNSMDEQSVAMAKARGFSVRAWGIKTEALMHRALELGADGMTINFPDKLTAALA